MIINTHDLWTTPFILYGGWPYGCILSEHFTDRINPIMAYWPQGTHHWKGGGGVGALDNRETSDNCLPISFSWNSAHWPNEGHHPGACLSGQYWTLITIRLNPHHFHNIFATLNPILVFSHPPQSTRGPNPAKACCLTHRMHKFFSTENLSKSQVDLTSFKQHPTGQTISSVIYPCPLFWRFLWQLDKKRLE